MTTKHTVRTRHRMHGFLRWYASCTCGQRSPFGNESDADAWRDQHAWPTGEQPHACIEATYVRPGAS